MGLAYISNCRLCKVVQLPTQQLGLTSLAVCRYLDGAMGKCPEDGFSYKFEGSAGMAVNGNTYTFKPPVFTWWVAAASALTLPL